MTDLEVSKQDNNIDFERIKELISKYEQIKNSGEIRKYKEEDRKKENYPIQILTSRFEE